jgi:glucosamine 6-phosphate synthetase-like amidotransferase/phosphosugar isomerase protein
MLNVFRGSDSTGVFSGNAKGEIAWYKDILPSPQLIYGNEDYADWVKETKENLKPVFFAGHTRATTKGYIDVESAHPFQIEKANGEGCVGIHNGTIDYGWETIGDYNNDSEYLYNRIYEVGLKKALLEVEAVKKEKSSFVNWKKSGAYALNWFDKKRNKLCFIRNEDRPLYFTVYNNHTLLWSSDIHAIIFAYQRDYGRCVVPEEFRDFPITPYIKTYKNGAKQIKYFTLNPGALMTLDGGKPLSECMNFTQLLANKELS